LEKGRQVHVLTDEVPKHFLRLCHNGIQIQYHRFQDLAAAESQQLPDRCGGEFDRSMYLGEGGVPPIV
jgi:hypothetical protein